jgi:hypothetical protein
MLPRMAHCKSCSSRRCHADVKIDVSRALRPGGRPLVHRRRFPTTYGILPVSEHEHALAVDRVRFVGDPVPPSSPATS